MARKPLTPSILLSAIVTKAVSAAIMGIIGALATKFLGLAKDLESIVAGVVVTVAYILVELVREGLREVGERHLRERAGIAGVLDNLQVCKEELQAAFRESAEVRLLLQIGRREFGDGDPSYFYSLAKELGSSGPRTRVLRASEQSPFLSKERAETRRCDVDEWRAEQRNLQRRINLLRDSFNVKIDDREHCEPFLWRIFLFDNVAYVSGYLYPSDNDQKAKVYKFVKGKDSLFSVFDKYFEYLWKEYDPEASQDPYQKWKDF